MTAIGFQGRACRHLYAQTHVHVLCASSRTSKQVPVTMTDTFAVPLNLKWFTLMSVWGNHCSKSYYVTCHLMYQVGVTYSVVSKVWHCQLPWSCCWHKAHISKLVRQAFMLSVGRVYIWLVATCMSQQWIANDCQHICLDTGMLECCACAGCCKVWDSLHQQFHCSSVHSSSTTKQHRQFEASFACCAPWPHKIEQSAHTLTHR